ncbi:MULTISPECIES: hypothetical protein [Flavobacterium]|nr:MULTISPECIES: hypothetical protein [Flavobacterium]
MKNLFTSLSVLLLSIAATAQSVKFNNPIITKALLTCSDKSFS